MDKKYPTMPLAWGDPTHFSFSDYYYNTKKFCAKYFENIFCLSRQEYTQSLCKHTSKWP